MTRIPVLIASLLTAGAAWAQPAPQPAPQPAAQPASQPASPQPAAREPERRPLILELDENARRQILSGTRSNETGRSGEELPSLGGDARRIDPAIMRGKPFPNESYSDRQTPQ